jgi:ABC-type branched-subunit amino acid transport system substrate-binding protein
MHRVFRLFVLLLIFSFGKAAAAEPQEVRLGLSMVLTGPFANWGVPVRNGLLLGAAHSKNRLLIEVQDDACDAKQSLTNFTRFFSVEKYKLGFLGCVESLEAVAPLLDRYDAVLFTLGGMTEELIRKYPRVQGLYSTVDTEARCLIPYLRSQEVNTMAIVSHSAVWGETIGTALEKLAPRYGIQVTTRVRVPMDQLDFRSVIVRLLSKRPQVVFVHSGEASEGAFIKQLREAGYTGRVYAASTFEGPEVVKTGGAALDGVWYTYPSSSAVSDTLYVDFVKEYKARYGLDPNNDAAIAYDLALLLDLAISRCGASDRNCLLKYFAELGRFQGVGGTLVIDKNRLPRRPHGLKQFVGGQYRWVVRELPQAED